MDLSSTLRGVFTALVITFFFISYSHAQIITTVAGGGLGNGEVATHFGIIPHAVTTDRAGNYYFSTWNNYVVYKVAAGTGVLTPVAGNGEVGYSGDGGPATAAELTEPNGLAVDGSGNVYIADQGNNRIRMVAASTGIITTIAGNGMRGYSGDGGPATAANLNNPFFVAVDSGGNLYIADSWNNRIRMVAAGTGIITTVAGDSITGYGGDGGPATAAELNYPVGLALDGSGGLYIADGGNNRIRMVAAGTGIISTIAGDSIAGYSGDGGPATAAELYGPYGIAIDGSGNLYISDIGNNRIRMVAAGTGVISTITGDSIAGYSGDGGPATAAELNNAYIVAVDSSGNLYIADQDNNRIRVVDVGTGIIGTMAGNGTPYYSGDGGPAAAAEVYGPNGIAIDSSGNLYIADGDNNRIRMVAANTGIISTVAGNGTSGYSGDGGPATAAEIYNPSGIVIDGSGNLYIADIGCNCIRMVAAGTGIISTVAGGGISGLGDGGPATAAELYQPNDVAIDRSGNIYISDWGNARIRMVAAGTGIITTVAGDSIAGYSGDGGPATDAELSAPVAVAVDSIGNIYITDYGNYRIRMVATGTGIISTVAGNGASGYSGDGGPATAAELNWPNGVSVDASGNLYIADLGNNCIRKVATGTGIITTIAGNTMQGYSGDGGPATAAELNYPSIAVVDASGNLYIADLGNNRIRMIGPCSTQKDTISQTICPGSTYTFGSQILSTSGTYYDTLIAISGCDSIVTLSLSILADSVHAYFTLHPSHTPHNWYALNQCTGAGLLTYSWTWGDSTAADTGATPSHTYADSGYYTICVTVSDSVGCSGSYCDSNAYMYKTEAGQMVQVNVVTQIPPDGIPTGPPPAAAVRVWPNPNQGSFTLQTSLAGKAEYVVYDILGNVVVRKNISSNLERINLTTAPGIYTLVVKSGDGSKAMQIIIEN